MPVKPRGKLVESQRSSFWFLTSDCYGCVLKVDLATIIKVDVRAYGLESSVTPTPYSGLTSMIGMECAPGDARHDEGNAFVVFDIIPKDVLEKAFNVAHLIGFFNVKTRNFGVELAGKIDRSFACFPNHVPSSGI